MTLNVPESEYDYNPNNSGKYSPEQLQASIDAAVEAAKQSDVAVIVAGLTNGWPYAGSPNQDTENFDRDNLDFPADQLQLIQAVAAANPQHGGYCHWFRGGAG